MAQLVSIRFSLSKLLATIAGMAFVLGACAGCEGLGQIPDATTEPSDGGVADARDQAEPRWVPLTPDAAFADLFPTPSNGLSAHFRQWLADAGYSSMLARDDLLGGSFGGFENSTRDKLDHRPVIFIHGNGDRALGGQLGGWRKLTDYLRQAKGYGPAELYGTSWGPGDPALAQDQHQSAQWLTHLRRFVEAVVAYTGAKQVDIIAHSMGVTLARKAILGGHLIDQPGTTLGPPLSEKVHSFVAIAGANQGLVNCYAAAMLYEVCSPQTGFFPGTLVGTAVVGLSAFLVDINAQAGYEGFCRYGLSSPIDEVIGYGGLVWGKFTAELPEASQSFSYALSHLGLRDETTKEVSDLLATPCGP